MPEQAQMLASHITSACETAISPDSDSDLTLIEKENLGAAESMMKVVRDGQLGLSGFCLDMTPGSIVPLKLDPSGE